MDVGSCKVRSIPLEPSHEPERQHLHLMHSQPLTAVQKQPHSIPCRLVPSSADELEQHASTVSSASTPSTEWFGC